MFSSGAKNFPGQDDPNGESPAVEVLQYKDKKGFFACEFLYSQFDHRVLTSNTVFESISESLVYLPVSNVA